VLEEYGLVHAEGGPEGETIAVPAQLLLAPDGTVYWERVARRIPDRADPAQVLAALGTLESIAGSTPSDASVLPKR